MDFFDGYNDCLLHLLYYRRADCFFDFRHFKSLLYFKLIDDFYQYFHYGYALSFIYQLFACNKHSRSMGENI